MKTVLLIDDDQVFRSLLSQALAAEGWKVLEAEDGETGLSLALVHRPAAILCDLLMPRGNGFQFCRALRSHEGQVGRPRIIVTTGSGYASDRRNAMEAGADDYLVKPIRTADLLQALAGASVAEPPVARDTTALQPARLRFWGVRGSIATPGPGTLYYGGNTACVEVRSHGEIIALDAGTGIRPLGLSLVKESKDQPIHVTVLVSHTHWDHIQGFPFFTPAYNPRNKIRILGYEGARRGLEITLAAQMESPYFPVSLQQMPGNITIQELRELRFTVGALPVQATFLNHPGICTGYRLFTTGGSIAYLPDVEPYHRFNASGGGGSEDTVMFQYAQSQDQRLVEFLRGSDLLIIDSQFDAQEYEAHVGWGHSCVDDSVRLAIKAGVKRMFMFHHDPGHDDAKISAMLEGARAVATAAGGNLQVEAAREGLEVVLEPVSQPAGAEPAALVAEP
jgi:phosphoribosyl 1,2-cyclic phosphodiesterase/CheY-like chemotaxis protein